MLIQEALKKTGKAYLPDDSDGCYVAEAGAFLRWWDMGTKQSGRELYRTELFSNGWQVYHEVKEIRPDNPEELWMTEKSKYFTCKHQGSLMLRTGQDSIYTIQPDIIHGKNGWTRLFPKVEDDSVDRIEIEGVTLGLDDRKVYIKEWDKIKNLNIIVRYPMKMILEIPKEG